MANTVQSNLASGILNQFHVSIAFSLQGKLEDWQGRQSVQYGAIKGLLTDDWHSLEDFNNEMSAYSSTNGILWVAWQIIKNLVPNNPTVLATLISPPGFGMVGQQILSLVGSSNIIMAPQDILDDSTDFDSTIGSVDA